ncbi:MAG: hypothetical protein AAGG44_16895 [Planctomycetota bacterium]
MKSGHSDIPIPLATQVNHPIDDTMTLVLTAKPDSDCSESDCRRVLLLPGQAVDVGTSPWCDLCVDDESISNTHFRVDLRAMPSVRAHEHCDLVYAGETVRQIEADPPIDFRVGSTAFRIDREAQGEAPGGQSTGIAANDPTFGLGPTRSTEAIRKNNGSSSSVQGKQATNRDDQSAIRSSSSDWFVAQPETLGVVPESIEEIGAEPTPTSAVLLLQNASKELDALRVWVATLEIHAMVCGALHLVSSDGVQLSGANPDGELIGLLAKWCNVPNEGNRVQIQERVPSSPERPEDWVCNAVNWTGGSVADANSPPVPPPSHMPYLAVVAAIQLFAAQQAQPLKAVTNQYIKLTTTNQEGN